MLSLDTCGPYLLVSLRENTGVGFVFDFRIVLQKIEKSWEQKKPSPIPNPLVLPREENTLQRILKLHFLRRHQSKTHELS